MSKRGCKAIIEDCIKKAAMTARIMVDDEGATKEEVNEFVAEIGQKMFEKYYGMSERAFVAECFMELVHDMDPEKLMQMIGGEK